MEFAESRNNGAKVGNVTVRAVQCACNLYYQYKGKPCAYEGFHAENFADGESVDVSIMKESTPLNNIMPKSALHEDDKGTYLFVVMKEQGAWGCEYVVRRMDVTVWVSTEQEFSS